MQKEIPIRQSNFELLRIISMFMIVTWHVLLSGVGLNIANDQLSLMIDVIKAFLVVHVNSFILVTGYFQSKSSFRIKKIVSLICTSWFYRILSIGIIYIFSLQTLSTLNIIKATAILPVASDHWFIHYYILLYLLSPFLNRYIEAVDQKELKRTIFVLLLINSCLPYLTNQEFFNNQLGFSLLHFITLYFIGAYFRKYPLSDSYHFKNITEKKFRCLMVILFVLIAFINLTIQYLGIFIMHISSGTGSFLFELGFAIRRPAGSYDFLLTVIQSCAYFLFFSTLHFKNRFINSLSKLMIGVYLFHESTYLKKYLYQMYTFSYLQDGSIRTLLKIFAFSLFIFLLSTLVEFTRTTLVKLGKILYLKLKGKFSKKVSHA